MHHDCAISVTGLEKRYRNTVAVTGLDFELRRGEVLGLIGPNGAGKSTTLRMLTGFLLPTRGRIEVMGVDRAVAAVAANRWIGYLPESVPLYPDLKVREYLTFRARLKGVGRRRRRSAVAAALARLELDPAAGTLIGHLSRGFRQRVGLAAALLGDPPVLVLDEPTLGLDPTQVRQIRELLLSLRPRHSILISSHALSELDKICDRVLMLYRGRRIALEAPSRVPALEGSVASIVLEVRGDRAALDRALGRLEGIDRVEGQAADDTGWIRYAIRTGGARAPLEAIGEAVHGAGGVVRELRSEGVDLERIFHRMLAREESRT